jgi:hypothetical protein
VDDGFRGDEVKDEDRVGPEGATFGFLVTTRKRGVCRCRVKGDGTKMTKSRCRVGGQWVRGGTWLNGARV